MSAPSAPQSYRFDNFLEETRILIKKSKASLYFQLIFCSDNSWKDMRNLVNEYPVDGRRNWRVKILTTQQDDFFILQFNHKTNEKDVHFFFWKTIVESNKVVILSFSLEKFQFVQSCLNSFISFCNMEVPWLGSNFLEDLDGFIKSTFAADAIITFDKIIYDLEPIGGKEKAQSNLAFSPISKHEILKKKEKEYVDSQKFLYIRRMRVRVLWKNEEFVFSISDDAQILVEKGDLIRFLEVINALKGITSLHRSLAERQFLVSVDEVPFAEGRTSEILTINNLEVLKLSVDNLMTKDWYGNLTTLFSKPFKKEEKLVNTVLMKGNPYFLVQVVDVEKGGSGVYLSATEKAIKISPSGATTNISTVLKVVEAMQKYVDPNITIAGG